MIVERHADCGRLYERTRLHLLHLLAGLSEVQLAAPVPATPAWSVHDVLAHVVGITVDLRLGRYGPGDQEAWTAQQVSERRHRSVAELAAEWDAEAPTFEEGLALFGYEMGSHFLGDLLHHVADVRHALGLPRLPHDLALDVALDFYLDSFHGSLVEAGIGSVVVMTRGERYELGEGPVVATLTVEPYELFRALGGRRTETQIHAFEWQGDVDRAAGLLPCY